MPIFAPAPQEYLVTLPTELILIIAENLPAADLAALIRTSHLLHTLLAHALDPHFVASAPRILLWAARRNSPLPLQRALSLGTPVPADLGLCRHTLLYESARDGHAQTVRVLLAIGVDPNTKSYDSTPLLIAVRRGHVSVARMLLEAGANVHQSFSWNPEKTPMMVARTYARVVNEEMVNLLLEFGAGDEGIHGPKDLGSNPRLHAKRRRVSGGLGLPSFPSLPRPPSLSGGLRPPSLSVPAPAPRPRAGMSVRRRSARISALSSGRARRRR
ncbi:uncharacterized protein LAJ45_11686 [Morchella importuna]|uniref:Ankyrin n=1 Tax=Morchella conica CCBAS932 TaxID=1392247 RepID=A0A3N4KYX7_9PEZI|nr:uncharacterized protein LAJ45_11686 [Morchella importuna]KAH8144345.1 hypothetical protein LAJ45_11686 [Morchella importuna]RPB15746.1 ankyrin [Morchella conica CCBAS932]